MSMIDIDITSSIEYSVFKSVDKTLFLAHSCAAVREHSVLISWNLAPCRIQC